MNHKSVVLLGVFIVLLLVMPGMAEDAQREDSKTAPIASGGGRDTQTPVLDGITFTYYDTVFFNGAMAKAHLDSIGVYEEGDRDDCHAIILNPLGYGFINCPFYSYDSKQGGSNPKSDILDYIIVLQVQQKFIPLIYGMAPIGC